MRTTLNALSSNLLWGLLSGLGAAVFFSLIAAVLYALASFRDISGGGVPLSTVIASYLLAGAVGGIVLGLLKPIVRRWWGAALAGTAIAFVLAFAIEVSSNGWITHWPADAFETMVSYALIFGPVGGVYVWNDRMRHRKSD